MRKSHLGQKPSQKARELAKQRFTENNPLKNPEIRR